MNRTAPDGAGRIVDLFVASLAWWTLGFHASIALGIGRNVVFAGWLVIVALSSVSAVLARSIEPQQRLEFHGPDRFAPVAVLPFGVAVLLAATGWATGNRWLIVWVLVLFGLAIGGLVIRRSRLRGLQSTDRTRSLSRPGAIVLGSLAIAFALLSLFLQRPDEDDVFLINRATYVEQHAGVFPTRDTIFSDQFFASQRPPGPQTTIEALIGSTAAALPVSAPFVAYFLLAPLASGLGVLALARLARTLGSSAPVAVTVAACVFLLFDASSHASFGNFGAGRAWQGKAIFVMVIVPALWHHGVSLVRTERRFHVAGAALASIAGIGLTSSATFVVPAIAFSILGPAAIVRRRAPLALAAAAIATPAGIAGLAGVLAKPQPKELAAGLAIDFGGLLESDNDPGDIVNFVFGSGVVAFVAILAGMLGWLVVPDRWARLALLSAVGLVFGVVLAPGVIDLLDDATGADAVLWRALWILPIPALVGLGAEWGYRNVRRVGGSGVAMVGGVVCVLALMTTGTALWSSENRGARLDLVPGFDLPITERAAAERLIELVPDGGVVAAPQQVGYPISVLSVDVRSVNPRWQYLNGRHITASFHATERNILSVGLIDGIAEEQIDDFVLSLERLEVVAACQYRTSNDAVAQALLEYGLTVVDDGPGICRFWS